MKSSYSKIQDIYKISENFNNFTNLPTPDDCAPEYCMTWKDPPVCHGTNKPCGSPVPTDTYYFCDSDSKTCKQSSQNDPKTYKNDNTCANSCNPSPTPTLCPTFDKSKGNWCKTDSKNPTCQDSGPSGIPIPCCTLDNQCLKNSCDLTTHRCEGWCLEDIDCNPNSDPKISLICNKKNNACVSKDPSKLGPQISASIKPSDVEINKIIENLNIPEPQLQNKKKPRSGRSFRMTLWHEGVVGIDTVESLTNYFAEMIQFIKDKQFDRVFFQLGDPYLTDSYGNNKFLYADPTFVINNMITPLVNLDVEIGALLDVDPSTIWTYNLSLPGGIYGNNPGYLNKSDCTMPFRQCDLKDKDPNKYCAEKAGSSTHGGIVIKTGCTSDPDKYDMTPFCLNYPPGCPNNLEQAMSYIGDINILAKKAGLRPITTIAFDGEDFAHYSADKYGMAQAWQAAKEFAPDVNEIGYAKGPSTNQDDIKTNAAYPELYWIGELKPTDNGIGVGCSGCQANAAANNKLPGCTNCVNSIYQQFKNKPREMLNAFKSLLEPYRQNVASAGCCPLFSIEHYHYGPNPAANDCIQSDYYSSGFCGTFDGFGDWDWDKFEQFMILYSNEFNAKEIGVYEWQFVPKQWRNSPSPSPINLCLNINCDNNKNCNPKTGKCVCNNGSSNTDCSISCSNNCSGHGICDDISGLCTCNPGWSGISCSNGGQPQPSDPCKNINCGNYGKCDNTGSCVCNSGWSGSSCDSPPDPSDPCININCGKYGKCNTGSCVCNSGWSGSSCDTPQEPSDPCININCGNYGKCDTGSCVCNSEWSGTSCEIPPTQSDSCKNINCAPKQTCLNGKCQDIAKYDYSWLLYVGIGILILILCIGFYFYNRNKK
jgi:hypothetical protein